MSNAEAGRELAKGPGGVDLDALVAAAWVTFVDNMKEAVAGG